MRMKKFPFSNLNPFASLNHIPMNSGLLQLRRQVFDDIGSKAIQTLALRLEEVNDFADTGRNKLPGA